MIAAVKRIARSLPFTRMLGVSASSAALAAAQLAMFLFASRMWGARGAGEFSLALAICAPITMFTNFSLRNVAAADPDLPKNQGRYVAFKLLNSLLALVMTMAVGLLAYREEWAFVTLLLVVMLYKTAGSWSEFWYGCLQWKDEIPLVVQSGFLRALTSVLAFVAAGLLTGSMIISFLASALMWAVLGFAIDRRRATVGARPQWIGISGLYLQLGALAASSLVLTITANVPRYLAEYIAGREMLGIFAAATYVIVISNLMVNAVHAVTISSWARLGLQSPPAVMKQALARCAVIVLLGLIAAGLCWPVSMELMAFVFGQGFAVERSLLPAVMLVAAASAASSMISTAIMSLRLYKWQLAVNLAAIVPLFIFSGGFHERFGLTGLVLAWLLSVVMQFSGYFLYLALSVRSLTRKEMVSSDEPS